MKFLFLGSGASAGVPVVACKCLVCKSCDPKNKRLRASGLLQVDGKQFLLDASPDIRYVALHYQIEHLDAVFLTHPHEDHIGGMNDLRSYSFIHKQIPMPLILSTVTYEVLKLRFGYLLDRFDLKILEQEQGEIEVLNSKASFCTYFQSGLAVNGFRFNQFAYLTDMKEYKESIFEFLDGVETLVLGAINKQDCKMHFTIDEACQFTKKINSVKRCYLTHLSHEVEHNQLSKTLPNGVFLSYDGLEIDV